MRIPTGPRVFSFFLILALVTIASPSAAQAPAVPAPQSPANGANVQVPFAITWSATLDPNVVNGGYNWQVSRSSSFAPLVMADSTKPSVTQDTISGLTSGTYFWRVQAVSPGGSSAWSQARSFVVTGAGPGTLGTPVLAPTRGYSTFHPWEFIHFDWTAVPGAVSYRLEVSNDPAFPMGATPSGTITFWNDNIPTNSDGYVHTTIGTFYARVFAVDADNPQEGVRSLPSNVIQFTCFYNNPIGPPPQLLSPLDNPTLTLPVTLSWAHVPNPQSSGYVLEIATDPGFSNVEFFYNQYTEPTQVFLSLTSGPKFWRVLSQQGLSSPTTNANTDWSTTGRFTISSEPPAPVSITLSGSPPIAYSGAERRLALQLTAGVPSGGATVNLASSHPALAPVPSTISMPGGHAWAEVPIFFGQVTSPTLITLSMTLNGATATSQITLRPPTLDNEFLQPEVRATGGAPMSGWVNLEGGGLAGPSGFVVSLSSSSAAVTVPASVTIAAGFHGSGFSMQTSAVDDTTVATITASAGGVSTSWAITLTPSAAPTKLIVRPMSTTSGSQGVALGPEGVGQDQLMQVASTNPSVASVPNSVTVSAGSGIGFFDITTAPVTEPTQVLISLSGGGVTLTQPLTLYPSLPPLTSITVSPGTVVAGGSATGTVRLGAPAPAVGVAVNLSSGLSLSAHVPDSVTIPGGATSATFPITTFPTHTTSVQISAQMDVAFLSSSITVTQAPSGASLSSISVNPTSVVGGNSATGTVTMSAAAPSGGAMVSLSDSSSATSVPSSVTVPAGATSANFTVGTSPVSATTSSTITASFGGSSRTVTLTANPGAAPTPTAPSLLSPSNQATVAQPITFDWTDVANAATYIIQIDSSSTFTTPLTYTATVSVSQTTVSGLPAQQLFWRVRGVSSAGATGPFSSSRRFTAQAAPSAPALSALAVSPSSVVGGNGSTGTVTLTSAAASGGLVVTLSSSNAVATVPASVTVPAGATSATFTIATSTVTASTSATITATQGTTTRAATVTVTAVPPPASVSALTVAPSSVTGGASSTGTVTLSSAAPTGGLAVSLASSNGAVASTPSAVTVLPGATSAQFTVTTSTVSSTTAVTLTATGGGATRTATLTVNPPAGSGPLAAPALQSPSNDARFSPGQSITFDWSDVAGAANYTIQIETSESFSAPFTVEQTVTISRFTTSSLPTTRMWWRVRANDASGAPGAWSAVRRVEVKD
jgi:hypothetical protein